jgi:hypothetical protein
VLKEACTEANRMLEEMVQQSGSLPERLGDFVEADLTGTQSHASNSGLILRELLEPGAERGHEMAERVINEDFVHLIAILREGQKDRELRADIDPAMVATVLIGANVFFFQAGPVLQHLDDMEFADDSTAYTRMLTDILLGGILKQSSPHSPPVGHRPTPKPLKTGVEQSTIQFDSTVTVCTCAAPGIPDTGAACGLDTNTNPTTTQRTRAAYVQPK